MSQELRIFTRFIDVIRNSKLSSRTGEMLEYLLYQLNLSMMSSMMNCRRVEGQLCGLPCDPDEIEDLNLLILAAGSGEVDGVIADREILERISRIVDQMHSCEPDV